MMQIDWWTLGLQAINFLVLVWLLQRFLYKPVQNVIEERRSLAETKAAEAKALLAEAQSTKQKYEEAQKRIEQDRRDILDQTHREIEEQRGKTMSEARSQAQAIISTAQQEINVERDKTLKAMKEDISKLAADVARTMLGDLGPQVPHDIFLNKIERTLNEMPESERTRIDKELADNGASLTIITARPLEEKERQIWQKRLAADLRTDVNVKFKNDASLLGGTEMHFPHTVLKFTWADQIERLTGVLSKNVDTSQ